MTSGLAATLTDLKWRKDAAKMVVLIADAPPHGELLSVGYTIEGPLLIDQELASLGTVSLLALTLVTELIIQKSRMVIPLVTIHSSSRGQWLHMASSW